MIQLKGLIVSKWMKALKIGGDKSTQSKDIEKAKVLAKEYHDE